MTENKKFCPLPWIFQAIRNNGDIRVCCQANGSASKGIYRKNDGTAFNAATDSLNESRNSDLAKSIRLSMLNDVAHEACIRCDREDSSDIHSRRQYENANWKDIFNLEDARNATNEDGFINTNETPAIYYDLRFGNLCNLKCRSCGPTDSSAWYDDQVALWGVESFDDSHGKVILKLSDKGKYWPVNNDYNWIESENFWNQIEKNIPNIQHIHTVGGEPLLIDKQYDLLQKCIDQDVASNITIEYNSNITNIPERAWNIWKHFKRIKIGASIDGIERTNDYIRYPSKWKIIEKNLHKLDMAEGNFDIWIAATVQIYNVLHLPEFMKWKLNAGFNRVNIFPDRKILTTHPLHTPVHMNIKILPMAVKEHIIEKYQEFYPWLEMWFDENNITDEKELYRDSARKILDSYVNFMLSEDLSENMDKFWDYTNRLDDIRNEKFKDSVPDLYEVLNEYK